MDENWYRKRDTNQFNFLPLLDPNELPCENIRIVTLTMQVLVILQEKCVCVFYMVTCIQLSVTPADVCTQVSITSARWCYRHLRAGVTVTNLYTLVKHAPRATKMTEMTLKKILTLIHIDNPFSCKKWGPVWYILASAGPFLINIGIYRGSPHCAMFCYTD